MNAYLFPALQATPDIFSALYALIPAHRLDSPTHPDRFTPRQVIAHLAHWEVILREERIVVPAEQPGAQVSAYDEAELAISHHYELTEVGEQLALFKAERMKTIALLQSLSKEQLDSTMVHPERGVSTVNDLANTMVGHDVYHIHQLTDLLLDAR